MHLPPTIVLPFEAVAALGITAAARHDHPFSSNNSQHRLQHPSGSAWLSEPFRLRTQSENQAFNHHWLSSSHTGFGTSVPVLVDSVDIADQLLLQIQEGELGYSLKKIMLTGQQTNVESTLRILPAEHGMSGSAVEWASRSNRPDHRVYIYSLGDHTWGLSLSAQQSLGFWQVCETHLPAGTRRQLFWTRGEQHDEGCENVSLSIQ